MPILQVREVPEPLYRKLQDEARRENRSLTQEAICALSRGLGCELHPKERRKNLIREIEDHVTPGQWDSLPDPVSLIREGRDR